MNDRKMRFKPVLARCCSSVIDAGLTCYWQAPGMPGIVARIHARVPIGMISIAHTLPDIKTTSRISVQGNFC